MKHFAMTMFLLLIANSSEVYSQRGKCAALSDKLSKESGTSIRCYCGNDLSNLEVTLPRGLRVDTVCDQGETSGPKIALDKEKASLDRYTKEGNYVQGEIYLTGQITLSGVVSMEPGNAGDLWFGATSGDARDKPVFLTYFRSFKLGRDSDYRKLGGPKPSYQEGMKCWSLDATLRIIDPKVVLIGTDSGGAYPRDIVVLKKTKPKFWKCYQ